MNIYKQNCVFFFWKFLECCLYSLLSQSLFIRTGDDSAQLRERKQKILEKIYNFLWHPVCLPDMYGRPWRQWWYWRSRWESSRSFSGRRSKYTGIHHLLTTIIRLSITRIHQLKPVNNQSKFFVARPGVFYSFLLKILNGQTDGKLNFDGWIYTLRGHSKYIILLKK